MSAALVKRRGPRGVQRAVATPETSFLPVHKSHPLLRLQRQLGNQAVSRIVEGERRAPSPIQRRIGITSAQLASTEGRTSKLKGALGGNTTFNHLLKALKDYEKSKDPAAERAIVTLIYGLAKHWLEKYGQNGKPAQKAVIEDIEAEAMTERGRLQAMQKYLEDMKSGGVSALSGMSKSRALPHAADVAAGKADPRAMGAGQAAVDLVRQYGLTEPEIAAIKVYTASDYKYINPATANSESWMAAQQGPMLASLAKQGLAAQKGPRLGGAREQSRAAMKNLKEQGALHAGAMMQAFSKLPPIATTTYRGSRESEQSFKSKYLEQGTMSFTAFASSATQEHPAKTFAMGMGEVAPQPNQTIQVMCIVKVTNGRKIEDLSIFGAAEKEVLLLPGATFAIEKIEKHDTGPDGRPKATAWYTVYMSQTK